MLTSIGGRYIRSILCLGQTYPYPGPWQPPPQPKDNTIVIIVVVLVVVFVVVPMVLGAIMYVMVSGLIESSIESEPNVQLDLRPVGAGNWEVTVAGVSEERSLNSFKAVLLQDSSHVDTMDPIGGSSALMNFTDLDGRGTLSTGDRFTVTCDPGNFYRLHIIWRASGNEKGSVSWGT